MLKERYTRDYSECLDLLYGIQMSVITEIGSRNDGSKILSAKPEPYSVLNMCIPERVESGQITLHDCFNKYCESEQLDGENAWFNDATGKKQPVNKSILFWSMPEIMVIDLKRFVPTSNYGRYKKNNTHIDIPLEGASFAKYVRGYSPEKYVYDLYGVCNHHGSINGGHYTATVRVADGRWFNFNDERVGEIVPKMTHLDGSAPYCLFYRRRK
jgi:ubiquitin C-terminal hydrolase